MLPSSNNRSLGSLTPISSGTENSQGASNRKEHVEENVLGAGGQLTFGAFAGLVSGYAVRQGVKLGAVVIGSGFVLMQTLSYLGYVDVNWRKVERVYYHVLDRDKDGKVTSEDFKTIFKDTHELLRFNLPSGAGFSSGFAYGLSNSFRLAVIAPVAYGAGVSFMLGGLPTDLFGLKESYGFSNATDWLRIKSSSSPTPQQKYELYLNTLSYYELRDLERSIETNTVVDADPVFKLLKFDSAKDEELVKIIIDRLKKEKMPANPIMRWI